MASKLLHLLIRDRLGEICHLLENPNSAPPICLAKNGSPYQADSKKGASQDADDPDAVTDSSVRFHMEKVVSLESLVMGVIETAFKQMVSRWSLKMHVWKQVNRALKRFLRAHVCCFVIVCVNGPSQDVISSFHLLFVVMPVVSYINFSISDWLGCCRDIYGSCNLTQQMDLCQFVSWDPPQKRGRCWQDALNITKLCFVLLYFFLFLAQIGQIIPIRISLNGSSLMHFSLVWFRW